METKLPIGAVSEDSSLNVQKSRAANLSVTTNVVLAVLKLVATILTGSISLLSELVHSITDIIASVLALASVKAAAVPPDEEHPYGHGKIESLAGFVESILLFGIVILIFFEAVPRIFSPSAIRSPLSGVLVMGLSSVVCFFTGRYVRQVGVRSESDALQSNGRHLSIDSVTSLGVLLALLITKMSGLAIADPLVACAIGCWIAWNAWGICKHSFNQLIDQRITDEDLQLVKVILAEEPEILGYHRLLTRHSGSYHYVQCHVVVPREYSVVQGHTVADRLEKRISAALRLANVVIHVDPLEPSKVARTDLA
jgi:cation diffusion facilitator family transporter